jgi:hypothetical protein
MSELNTLLEKMEEDKSNSTIEFTQYILPNGRKKQLFIHATKEYVEKSKAIIEEGNRFEIEVLRTGAVSMTIFNMELEEDINIELCFNETDFQTHLHKLIDSYKGL